MESLTNRSIQVTMTLKFMTMRRMVSLIPGHCSMVFSSLLHFTSWWHLPTGISEYQQNYSDLMTENILKYSFYPTFRPNSTLETLNTNPASMWVKIVSSWLCVGLYGWSLIAPIVLRDRVFEWSTKSRL